MRAAILLSTLALLLAGAPTALAGATESWTSVEIDLAEGRVFGVGLPERLHVVTVRSPDGVRRARAAGQGGQFGDWEVSFPRDRPHFALNAGDELVVRADGRVHRLRIPRLRVDASRSDDVAWGRAPANARFSVRVLRSTLTRRSTHGPFNVTADAQGNWRRDLTSGVDILGGDQIEVLFVNASGDLIRQSSIVPYMTITNGHDHVTGVGARDVLVTIKLKRHGSTVGIGHGWTVDTPIDGSLVLGGAPRGGAEFRVLLADGSGMAAYPRPGDVVVGSFAPDARLRMPSIFVEGDMSTEMIHGRCLPSTTFWLSIYDQGIRLLSTNGDTAPDGSFDFSAGFFGDDIGPLASVYVECIAPRGDRVATWGGVTP